MGRKLKRKCHFLKPGISNQYPSNCIWFDTETHEEEVDENKVKHVLDFGWAAYRRRIRGNTWTKTSWYEINDIQDFWRWVDQKTRPKTRLFLFCHNTSFDLPVLDTFHELPSLGWKLKVGIIDAPPTILIFEKDTKKIVIVDTLNIWRMPLKTLGNYIGLEKLDMPFHEAPIQDWDEYCKRDVEIIMKAVITWIKFLKDNDFGGFAMTLASQAMKLYRHKHMRYSIGIHNDAKVCDWERDAYKGGRNECYRIGHARGTWYLYDVNSMYPYVMAKYQYPTLLKGTFEDIGISDMDHLLDDYMLIARVSLNTDEPVYGIRYNNKLVFPIGRFDATLTTSEIEYALLHDHITKVHYGAYYLSAYIFKSYIKDLYTRRLSCKEKGDKTGAQQYKLLLNSLYGKFGQRGIVWSVLQECDDLDTESWVEINADTGQVVKYRKFAGVIQHQETESESRDSFPAIAAHVTANARIELWRYINEAGKNNTIYCDTDSLLVDEIGSLRLRRYIHPSRLGFLKREGVYKNVILWGCKDYYLDGAEKHKGIRKQAEQIGPDMYRQDKWAGLRGMLQCGIVDAPTTERVTKHLYRNYDKGMIQDSGLVVPFIFEGFSGVESRPMG